MKIYKIVIFIFAIIAILGCICYFFPSDGLSIGPINLKFASLEKVLTNKDQTLASEDIKLIDKMEDAINDTVLESNTDSLEFYKNLIENYESRIYLPGNDVNYFNAFFAKAEKAKGAGRMVRVLHYGDSQIELDRISGELRRFFQSKFGGGGPGLLPIVQTVPRGNVSQWSSESFTLYTVFGRGNRDKEKKYGIMTKYYRVGGSGTCKISRTQTNHVRLMLNDKTGNFKASLVCSDTTYEKSSDSTAGFHIYDWHLPRSINEFSLKFQGTADLYGVMVDNGSGVTVDNIPMRGSSGTVFTGVDASLLQQSYQQTDVGMIILQYGGNSMPSMSSSQQVKNYASSIGAQIRYLKNLYPNTPILFIGPSDMSTMVKDHMQSYPLMEEMVEALKETALNNGAAFWNIYEVMGGHNSMLAWVNQGLAGKDYVHFSPAGANKIGSHLVDAFSTIYDYYAISH